MKNLFLACFVAIFALNVSAQNALFPTKKGMEELHAQKDEKGNIQSYARITITEVEGSGGYMTISYTVEALDKDQKAISGVSAIPLKTIIKDNVITTDLKSLFAGQNLSDKIDISGGPMELPNKLSVGQAIKDATITMTMKGGLVKTKTEIKIHDGKCEAIENVKVPAGTYKCYKVSQTATTSVFGSGQTFTSKSTTWYSEGVGTVKSQNFDNKGTLLSTSELIQVK